MTSPLIIDVYAGDLGGNPKWSVLAELGTPWHGAVIKATEGASYGPAWFDTNWRQLKHIAPDRYGVDWFRGAYHFLKFNVGGVAQADFYLRRVEKSGGWDVGDLWPIVDVELGGEKNSNQLASAQQIIDCTTAWAERVRAATGRKVMLYGNGAMRDKHITTRMGCDYLWCPRYTETLPREIYERAGWTEDELVMWQYSGDGHAVLAGYPDSPPGFGACDVSVLVAKGGIEWLRSQLFAEHP